LKEGGDTLAVTNENKREFVQLSASYRLYSSIKDQIESLLTGFYEVIPKELITIVSHVHVFLLSCFWLTPSFSSTNKSWNCSSLELRTLTSMSGALQLNTSATPARTPTLFGGGVPSSPSIVTSEPRFCRLQLAHPRCP
jgi:hypothetical protein